MTPTQPRSLRLLPGDLPLKNRLLASLPDELYAAIATDIRLVEVKLGEHLITHGVPVSDVFFPNGGVYSCTNQMNDGSLVEVATVGIEGMMGVSVFWGDMMGVGTSIQQVPNGPLPTMTVQRFIEYASPPGPFRDAVSRYAQAHLLTVMQCAACNALHHLNQRCCRWSGRPSRPDFAESCRRPVSCGPAASLPDLRPGPCSDGPDLDPDSDLWP